MTSSFVGHGEGPGGEHHLEPSFEGLTPEARWCPTARVRSGGGWVKVPAA